MREILTETAKSREDGVKEVSHRAVSMGLCGSDTPGDNMLYSLGSGGRYWDVWLSPAVTDADRVKWVREILTETDEGRLSGGITSEGERLRRAVSMGMCGPDPPGASLLYSFGRRYWDGWYSPGASDGQRVKWVLEILTEEEQNGAAGNVALSSMTAEGHVASIIGRVTVAASLRDAMYSRLSIISGHTSTYAQDMETWLEDVLLPLEALGRGPVPRTEVLRKLGISTKTALNTFNSMFKKSWGRQSPRTGKAKYKRELLEAKLKHIERTPWPSTAKGEVSGVGGEEERLLTVLYYDLVEISKRESKGEHDDESD